jgi:hypothetical protein
VRPSSPTVLEAAASAVRAWQEDVRLAAERMGLPDPGDPLPTLRVGVLLEPIDLAALIGLPEPAASPEGPPVASATNHPGPAELTVAHRSQRLPERLGAPPAAAPPSSETGAPATRSGWHPERWPASLQRRPAPMLPAAPGAGAARIAAVLQRYEEQAGALGEGSTQRSDRTRPERSHRKTASPASARRSRGLVALPARSSVLRSRTDVLASMEDAVSRRLRSWSQGLDVPPLPDPARPAADADTARPSGPPATRLPSPRSSRTPGGVIRQAGPASAGRGPAPVADIPASPQLAKLIDLLERAVRDLAAAERRLAELGGIQAPQVQWLEDDELAGRLQGILARQARRRGIDLS